MHIFFTRLALLADHVSQGYRCRSPEQVRKYVNLWHDASSKFYIHQTIKTRFRVVLLYNPIYEAEVRARPIPYWAEAYPGFCDAWLRQHKELLGQKVFLTRVDADDSYSIDFMERVVALGLTEHALILHKKFKQYDLATQTLTVPMRHLSPHFATVHFPELPAFSESTVDQFIGVHGNHTEYYKRPHLELEGCFALERITGYNVINRPIKSSGHGKAVVVGEANDPRFVGYGP